MRLLLVGCGSMGSALLQGWLQAKLDFKEIAVISPHLTHEREHQHGPIKFYCAIEEVPVQSWDVVVFAVKPKVLPSLLPQYRQFVSENTLFISIAAAIPLNVLEEGLGEGALCARVMPNTPVILNKGVLGLLMKDTASLEDRKKLEALCSPLGDIVWVKDDEKIDQITALSGCGPAYVFHMIEALAEVGESLGFSSEQALRLAKGTLWGASVYAHESQDTPDSLRQAVTSSGGMTEAALGILMSESTGFRSLLKKGIEAALKRGEEIRAHGSAS